MITFLYLTILFLIGNILYEALKWVVITIWKRYQIKQRIVGRLKEFRERFKKESK